VVPRRRPLPSFVDNDGDDDDAAVAVFSNDANHEDDKNYDNDDVYQ
jgi:hypothetical protein